MATDSLNDLTVYRIQDADGRGPYKPGMSAKWADKDIGHYRGKLTNLPPFHG